MNPPIIKAKLVHVMEDDIICAQILVIFERNWKWECPSSFISFRPLTRQQ